MRFKLLRKDGLICLQCQYKEKMWVSDTHHENSLMLLSDAAPKELAFLTLGHIWSSNDAAASFF